MKARAFKYWASFMVAFCLSLASCHDEEIYIDEDYVFDEEITTRTYDDALEWDGVTTLPYKSGNTSGNLIVPWAPGSTHSMGIPTEWIQLDLYQSPSAENRIFSRYNGWELVYSNLSDSEQSNKYFALYNKYTGILRIFFYQLKNSATGSVTHEGIQVAGSKLLNFTFGDPKPMDESPDSATYVFFPQSKFQASTNDTISLNGVAYASDNWYGLEVECAYDVNTNSKAKMRLKVWSDVVTITDTNGSLKGFTTGNISTIYSNNPLWNFDIQYNDRKTTVIQTPNDGAATVTKKIQESSNFWTSLKSKIPELAEKGIQALFTGSASTLVNIGGRLLSSALGMGNDQTLSSLSEVKLDTDAQLSLNTVSTTSGPG